MKLGAKPNNSSGTGPMTRTTTCASLATTTLAILPALAPFSVEDRRELFYNVTNPQEELSRDVVELALEMLTLAMRRPEKFTN